MPLDPEIAAILRHMPTMPRAGSVPVAVFRAAVNRATAAAPKLDVALRSIADRTIPGPGGEIPVRVYTPEGIGTFPILVYFHGGGYVIGDLNSADPICRALSHGGKCVVMSVDYRLAPEHPFPIPNDDAYAATLWASIHAAKLGADSGRLAVGGDSAGANLSAAVTLRARDCGGPNIRAQLLMYPSPDYPNAESGSFIEYAEGPMLTADDSFYYWQQYLGDVEKYRHDPDACPSEAASHSGLPSAFVATGECDASRDSGEAYAAKLLAAGVPTEMQRYAGMPHGFFNWVGHVRSVNLAMSEVCDWLKRQLV